MFCKLKIKSPTFEVNREAWRPEHIVFETGPQSLTTADVPQSVIDYAVEKGIGSFEYYAYENPRRVMAFLPLDLVSENLQIEWQVIKAKSFAAPHIDQNRLCAINFYVKANGEETVYYKDPINEYVVNYGPYGLYNKVYLPEWLTRVDSFVAKTDEVWCLDVSKIHSVENFTEGEDRISITVGFKDKTYEDVCEILHKHNLIEQ